MIKFIIGIIAIILVGLVGFMITQSEKKVEDKVTKKDEIKAINPHEIVKPKVSQTKNKVLAMKSNNAESRQEDPENELENTNLKEKSTWHISDKEMEVNEKDIIEKYRQTKRANSNLYENDDSEGINGKNTPLKPASPLSEKSLLAMEEAHLSKQVHKDKEPLEDTSFDPKKY